MRTTANAILFALIGGITAALSWPDDKALTWRFWAGALLGTVVALKAYFAKSGSNDPIPVSGPDGGPVKTEDVKVTP